MQKANTRREYASGAKLHIGSGDKAIAGWVNIDLKPFPGVDVVADVTKGLAFTDAEAVFAEHFLEHLRLDHAIEFILEAHRVLRKGAWIRLSTPNLDWVWQTHYQISAEANAKQRMALHMNRAFHGWGHQFLWNKEMLELVLRSCGFEDVRWCSYGQSELSCFDGLERHEIYADTSDLAHVIIAEAKKGDSLPEDLDSLRILVAETFLIHLEG